MYRISCQAAVACIILCGLIGSRPVQAQIACNSVDKVEYKDDDRKELKGWKTVRTPADDMIKKYCTSSSWTDPLDNWRYGDYDFLFSTSNYKGKDLAKVLGSRKPEYITQIRRYACTFGDKPLGYFAFHLNSKAANPTGELTFLCVLEKQSEGIGRGAGLGFDLFNTALTTAGEAGRNTTINLNLKALPTATPFYDSLDVDCTHHEDSKVTEYDTGRIQFTKQGGARVARRFFSYDENWHAGKASYKRIDYGCVSKDDYDRLVKLAQEAEDNVGPRNPLSRAGEQADKTKTITFAAVRRNICNALHEHHLDKDLSVFCK